MYTLLHYSIYLYTSCRPGRPSKFTVKNYANPRFGTGVDLGDWLHDFDVAKPWHHVSVGWTTSFEGGTGHWVSWGRTTASS